MHAEKLEWYQGKDRGHWRCRSCNREKVKAWRKDNYEYSKEQQNQYRRVKFALDEPKRLKARVRRLTKEIKKIEARLAQIQRRKDKAKKLLGRI